MARPGPLTTGPDVAPTVHYKDGQLPPDNDRYVFTDGTIVDGQIIDHDILVIGKGVIIRNSIVNGIIAMQDDGSSDITIENSRVIGTLWKEGDPTPFISAAIMGPNTTVRRSEVIGSAATTLCPGGCTWTDNYTHGQIAPTGVDTHNSGFGSNGNQLGTPVLLRHNTLWCTLP